MDDDDDQMMYTAAAAVAEAALLVVKANTVFLSGLLSADEEAKKSKKREIDHRLLPRKKRVKWKHSEALQCIKRDYFGCDTIPDSPLFRGAAFVMMFRLSRSRVELLMRDIMAADIPFYSGKKDCFRREVPSIEARILLPLKTIAYGVAPHAFTDYFQMSESMARQCCLEFDAAVKKIYEKEYLRLPTKADMKSICNLHKEVHKVDGMFGSIDCMHTRWKNCPKAWAGQYSGKEGDPTIVLEAISDHHMWFWHASYGYAGTLNDLNILNLSPFLDALVSGKFAEVETDSVPFQVGEETFHKTFVLADGIYPSYCRFVKSQKEPITDQEKLMTTWQEACRKDIERAFGVLQGKFQWIARPIHLMKVEDISNRVATCLILHNMTVSDRVMKEVGVRYQPSYSVEEESDPGDTANSQEALDRQEKYPIGVPAATVVGLSNMDSRAQHLITSREAWNDLKDKKEHGRLHKAIMTNLYEQQQERRKKRNPLK